MPDDPTPAGTAPLNAWVAGHPLWATLAIGAALLVVRTGPPTCRCCPTTSPLPSDA